jgi:fructose-bisphosphate aldolase class I
MEPAVVKTGLLTDTAQAPVGGGRGLLAMDESNGTCNKRFAVVGIARTEASRRAYRILLVTTPDLAPLRGAYGAAMEAA